MPRHPEPKQRLVSRLAPIARLLGYCILIAALIVIWRYQLPSPEGPTAGFASIERPAGATHAGLVTASRARAPSPFESQPLSAARLGADAETSQTSVRPIRLPGSALAAPCAEGLAAAGGSGCRAGADSGAPGTEEQASGREIAGRVVSSDGLGIAGVTVIATLIPGSTSEPKPSASGYQRYRTISDANGAYSFAGLPEGDYTIRSNRHDHYPSVRISVGDGIQRADIVLRSE